MVKEINFLSERRRTITKQEKLDKRLVKMAAIFLSMVLVVVTVVLGTTLYIQSRLRQVQAQQQTIRGQITDGRATEEAFVIFVRKLTSLAQLDQARQDKRDTIAYFSTIFGQNVFVQSIEFDQKNKLLIFRIQSDDVFALKNVLNVVNSADVAQKFQSVNPSDLARMSDGTYQLSIAVAIKKTT
jgi:hypothetical protein